MGKTTKKNTDIFKEEIFHLIQDEYNVVGEYINAKTKIKMIHNICQFEYEVTPSNFKKGSRCPKCRNKEISIRCRRTHEQFIKEIHNKVGLEYSVLSKYQTSQTSIEMKHNICGYKWDVSPNSFLRGSRCPKCANEFRKNKFMKKHETFMNSYCDSLAKNTGKNFEGKKHRQKL
jgi:predicted Zn-ribbon and HTH transcriptional regulator